MGAERTEVVRSVLSYLLKARGPSVLSGDPGILHETNYQKSFL